ncbi:MAG: formate dehydrogenase subunit gamma [Alphaproteobacteria bacterium]
MVRIGAAITVIVVGALLGLTIAGTFGHQPVIVPTGGVTDGGPQDMLPSDEPAQQVFRERTRLQRYRGESGPSPDGARSNPVFGTDLEARSSGIAPAELTRQWLADEDRDWQMLRDRGFINGISPTLADPRASMLQQPQGRDWRRLHNHEITYGGGWVIFGFSLLLALFLLIRGRIPLKEGFSGKTVRRFEPLERANHWFTASSFVMLALTGLVLLYGQMLLKPWMGAVAYRWLAQASLYTHVAFSVAFALGLLCMVVMWTGRNLPKKVDWQWLKRGGGFMSDKSENPPAEKFNAGQKLIFWSVFIGGGLLILSGLTLMFPFFWFGIEGMQWALIVHAALGLIMTAVIIGHIYIGTVGMVGAIDAMWSGDVDRNWAEEHHSLWVQNEIDSRGKNP